MDTFRVCQCQFCTWIWRIDVLEFGGISFPQVEIANMTLVWTKRCLAVILKAAIECPLLCVSRDKMNNAHHSWNLHKLKSAAEKTSSSTFPPSLRSLSFSFSNAKYYTICNIFIKIRFTKFLLTNHVMFNPWHAFRVREVLFIFVCDSRHMF